MKALALSLIAGLCSSCQSDRLIVESGRYQMNPLSAGAPDSARVVSKARDGKLRILVLTSGGADGAFGAGVLAGWTAAGTRPRFDVVSGTSTGALQATAAFLGSDYDAVLQRLYTSTRTRDLLRSNGIKTFFRSGRYDPAPLRTVLEDYITEAILDEVAREHRAGRRLYVSTTDLTAGRTSVWDMGALAAEGGDRRERYINVLVASAAAPGLIEPVYVKDTRTGAICIHGDGGVKSPVPLENFMLDSGKNAPTAVWVIANGHVSREGAGPSDAASTISLAQRAVSQLLRQLLYTSVREAEAKARQSGAEFHLVSLPLSVPEAEDPFIFQPAEMEKLFAAGKQVARSRFRRR